MPTRRQFLTAASASASSWLLGRHLGAEETAKTRSGLSFGVQLYQVRDLIQGDADGKKLGPVLKQIADIGYQSVETFPSLYNRSAKALRKQIEDQGLQVHSGHFDYEGLEQKIDFAAELGLNYMICPMIPQKWWGTLDGFHQAADNFNQIAARAKAAGLRFGYHAHNYEYLSLIHI